MTRNSVPRTAAALVSMVGATGLVACSDDDAGQVVITEVVTSTAGAPADATGTTEPAQSGPQSTIPEPRFRTVESDTYTGDGVHLFTSASGTVHCQLLDQSTGGFTEDIAGGCFTGPPTGEEAPDGDDLPVGRPWKAAESSPQSAREATPGISAAPAPSSNPGR
ncbi:hypothetical protein QP028_16170 [Corynebacterium suedekumii]|nr:hypothetical protein QP028_16170 [Corynebacterium suedekumii]